MMNWSNEKKKISSTTFKYSTKYNPEEVLVNVSGIVEVLNGGS